MDTVKIIEEMEKCGFGVTTGGIVTHPVYGDFKNWTDAIITCLRVATEH